MNKRNRDEYLSLKIETSCYFYRSPLMKIYILLRLLGVILLLHLFSFSLSLSFLLSLSLDTRDFSPRSQFSMVRFEILPLFFHPLAPTSLSSLRLLRFHSRHRALTICQMHIQFWKSTVFPPKENFYKRIGSPPSHINFKAKSRVTLLGFEFPSLGGSRLDSAQFLDLCITTVS